MDNNFFPLCAELVESQEFKGLPITEKLFLIQLISDSNRNPDGWYKADIEYSALLGVSINKIRQARPRLKKLGFIEYESGQLKANRKFATRYTAVKFARPEPPFAKVHRYTYTSFLVKLRKDKKLAELKYHTEEKFTHSSLLFWLLSAYKAGRTTDTSFSVFKSFYADYGIKSKALSQAIDLTNGQFSEPFIRQNYHKVTFDTWSTYKDPDVNEHNRRIHEQEEANLQELIDQHRKKSNHDEYWKAKRVMELKNKGKSDAYIRKELNINQADLKSLFADESSRLGF